MFLLLASLFALAAGPTLAWRLRPDGAGMAALDGFVLVAVSGLVFLHLLPDAVLTGGWWAVAAASVGLVLPGMGERILLHRAAPPGQASGDTPAHAGWALLSLALAGLLLHAALDGAALLARDLHDVTAAHPAAAHGHAEPGAPLPALAVGVILHRLPLGLAVWWAAGQGPRRRRAVALLTALGLATVAGFLVGQEGLAHLPLRGLAVFQALVAGALIHVVFQHPPVASSGARVPTLAAAAGGLVGAAALVGLAWLHKASGHGAGDPAPWFLLVALRAAPALLGALAVSAALRGRLARSAPAPEQAGRHPLRAALSGLALPLRVPACPCHTRAHFRDLLARHVPPAKALAYLLSSPALGLVPWALAWVLVGPALAAAWALAATLTVLLASLAGAVVARPSPPVQLGLAPHDHPLPAAPVARALASVRPLVGHSLAWALAGAALGAYVGPRAASLVPASGPVAAWVQVLVAAALAAPLYMGGAGAVPVSAALLAAGLGAGPTLAALVTLTALHPSSLALVASTLGARAAAVLGGCVIAGAATAGVAVQALGLQPSLAWAAELGVTHHDSAAGHALPGGPLAWLAVGGVAALLLASLLRLGPRGLLAEMFPLSR